MGAKKKKKRGRNDPPPMPVFATRAIYGRLWGGGGGGKKNSHCWRPQRPPVASAVTTDHRISDAFHIPLLVSLYSFFLSVLGFDSETDITTHSDQDKSGLFHIDWPYAERVHVDREKKSSKAKENEACTHARLYATFVSINETRNKEKKN